MLTSNCVPPYDEDLLCPRLKYILNELDSFLSLNRERLVVNSAFRSVDYEIEHGRSGKSAHTTGEAVDISVRNNHLRCLILGFCFAHGIKRIGVSSTFIHIDVSESLSQNVFWLY